MDWAVCENEYREGGEKNNSVETDCGKDWWTEGKMGG
jgi:hypothetical protein